MNDNSPTPAIAATPPVLALRGVGLCMGGRTLFADVSATVGAGQMLGIAGESGSGKTSLLRAILGFVPTSAGAIEVCGLPLDAAHVDALRRLTAYVPQELMPLAATGHDLVALTHSLGANRNVATAATAAAAGYGAVAPQPVAEVLASLGLEPSVLDLTVAKLSGGQRQRILIAAALALPKPLILLDEPTSALDAETAQLTTDTLLATLRREQRAAVVVSHSERVLAACTATLTIQA
ncbi:MAG: ABC transporter ATP-binding protein [Bacteroidaceae bacterium]|nr:ABC transporter ATP-binding protein [Bacteroidaceae bacterium]